MSTLGEELKQARLARKLTIKQVVQAIRVRAHYLEAMEADDFSNMPSGVQARGFLRLYAEFLGLDADQAIARQKDEFNPQFNPPGGDKPALETTPVSSPKVEVIPEPPPPPPVPAPTPVTEKPEESEPTFDYQVFFREIGHSLRDRRELISLTIEEIERHTHIRKHNLEIIEAGNLDDLPSPVQARGMRYCAEWCELFSDRLPDPLLR